MKEVSFVLTSLAIPLVLSSGLIETIKLADGTKSWVTTDFSVHPDSWPDNDDIYEKSGVNQITEDSLDDVINSQGYFYTDNIAQLGHINQKLGKKYY